MGDVARIIAAIRGDKAALAGSFAVMFFIVLCLGGGLVVPYSAATMPNLSMAMLLPGEKGTLLGTDELGRDMLARIIWGGQNSLVIGLTSAILGALPGVMIGLFAGYYSESPISTAVMRLMDVLLAMPRILLGIIVVAILGPGEFSISLAIGVSTIPSFARITRASTLALRGAVFVEASRAIGNYDSVTLFKHILPNILSPIIVQFTLDAGQAILMASGLSFLGLGPQPPAAEWGLMIAQARVHLFSNPQLVLIPGLCLLFVTLGFNIVGDSLRDAIDPSLGRVSRSIRSAGLVTAR
ncbi:Glutathione transport system permease protein GsiD [Aminobacter sp. MSH1]|uniref:ABC transporter permease n=1 Tax=Aminobacter sp. MSH1 TaxID=374606 RepID=UPI000D37F3F1|nr:ABC transporter permease [Aminobacter sp. MSH1]AWC20886.1 Glutathione transport system permease protein GsiD [Aminobacter sp. MSH1]